MFEIECEEDSRRIDEFPVLPGLLAHGETVAEARDRALAFAFGRWQIGSSMASRRRDRSWAANLACLLAIALLAGCAASGPVSIGPDTYLMANTGVWSWSSGAVMETDLFRRANRFCKAQGRQLMGVNVASTDADFTRFAHAQLRFRCLRPGNPELRPPNLEAAPNLRIEGDMHMENRAK